MVHERYSDLNGRYLVLLFDLTEARFVSLSGFVTLPILAHRYPWWPATLKGVRRKRKMYDKLIEYSRRLPNNRVLCFVAKEINTIICSTQVKTVSIYTMVSIAYRYQTYETERSSASAFRFLFPLVPKTPPKVTLSLVTRKKQMPKT